MKRSPRLALPLLAAGIGACAPDAVTLPGDLPAAPALDLATAAAAYGTAADLAVAVEDADLRVIPTLGDAPEVAAVDAAFAGLAASIAAADAEAARNAALGARQALASLEAAGGDVMEIAALTLVVEGAEALYGTAPATAS